MFARGWEGGPRAYRFCASPFLKEFCMARLRLYWNPARFFSWYLEKEAPPLPPAAHSFSHSPRQKNNQNGNVRQGQWAATRGTPRVARVQSVPARSWRTSLVRLTTCSACGDSSLCAEEVSICGPTGSRTPTYSMPWSRSTAILWAQQC